MSATVRNNETASTKIWPFEEASKVVRRLSTSGKDHALFICYAPADSPRVALAVVAENRGHGGSVAAPIAAKVLARLLLPDSLQNKIGAPRPVVPDTTVEVVVGD